MFAKSKIDLIEQQTFHMSLAGFSREVLFYIMSFKALA